MVPSPTDQALTRILTAQALTRSKQASLEEVRKMRKVILGMSKSKLRKAVDIIFEGEEVKYEQLK